MGAGSTVSIARATAIEILSEPLTLLVALASLALAVFAPTFHYHQFGEVTRMARDSGLSAAFTGGLVLSVFGTIRSFRREIESGTLEMALSRPVTRGGFFVAKTIGAALAYAVFAATLLGTTLVVVEGAAVGGEISARTGDIARVWGPCVAVGVAIILLPLAAGAALNRFFRFRFVLTSMSIAVSLSAVSGAVALFRDPGVLLPYLAVFAPLAALALVFIVFSAACAVRFSPNAAAACAGLLFAATLPFVGNYYLSDALSRGGSPDFVSTAGAVAAAIPAIAAFTILGVRWTAERT